MSTAAARAKEVNAVTDGKNVRLLAGLLIGASVAVVVESGVVYGVVGATASMGALALAFIAGIAVYALAKVLMRSRALRRTSVDFSNGPDLGAAGRGKVARLRPVTEKDKRVIMGHIDELLVACRHGGMERPGRMAPVISEADKRAIMGGIDKLLEMGREHGGGVHS